MCLESLNSIVWAHLVHTAHFETQRGSTVKGWAGEKLLARIVKPGCSAVG
jgi:hypothetical protein